MPKNWKMEYDFRDKPYSDDKRLPEFKSNEQKTKSVKIDYHQFKDRPIDE